MSLIWDEEALRRERELDSIPGMTQLWVIERNGQRYSCTKEELAWFQSNGYSVVCQKWVKSEY